MRECIATHQEIINLDPFKRVNYTYGMVLGVDEFLQEELYLLSKQRHHNRLLHGYGTVCGLAVSLRDTADGPEVGVRSGVAVDPAGREVRVPQDQCTLLNPWLNNNKDKVRDALTGSPPVSGPMSLYLTLCYEECKTDAVPLPSGPCQSFEETTAPSRVADSFVLRLDANPPEHNEEKAIRKLVELLRRITVSAAGPRTELTELLETIRGLSTGSLPVSSPPLNLNLHPDDARKFLRAALRVWVTEVRPTLILDVTAQNKNCISGPPLTECILLARLDFSVQDTPAGFLIDGTVANGDVKAGEDERPYLIQSRLLQEWLMNSYTLFERRNDV